MSSNFDSNKAKNKPPQRGTSSFGGAVAPVGGATEKPPKPSVVRSARKSRVSVDVTRPTVSSRSKYTEKKPVDPESLRSRSFNLTTNTTPLKFPKNAVSTATTSSAGEATPKTPRKPTMSTPTAPKANVALNNGMDMANVETRSRAWLEKRGIKKVEPEQPKPLVLEKLDLRIAAEVSIQTNEAEIVNNDLLIGDVKYLLPSAVLVAEIDRQRQEELKRTLLKAQRKYEEHSAGQEQHLTDLKEFLENATITKIKPPNKIRSKNLDKDRKLIKAMDETLKRGIPKTESVTNIKNRIKQKEDEVIKMLENVEQIAGDNKLEE